MMACLMRGPTTSLERYVVRVCCVAAANNLRTISSPPTELLPRLCHYLCMRSVPAFETIVNYARVHHNTLPLLLQRPSRSKNCWAPMLPAPDFARRTRPQTLAAGCMAATLGYGRPDSLRMLRPETPLV